MNGQKVTYQIEKPTQLYMLVFLKCESFCNASCGMSTFSVHSIRALLFKYVCILSKKGGICTKVFAFPN